MKDEAPAVWYNANGYEQGPIGELRSTLPPSDELILPTEQIGGFPPWWLVVWALFLAAIVAGLVAIVWTSPAAPRGTAAPGAPGSACGSPGAESPVVGSTP